MTKHSTIFGLFRAKLPCCLCWTMKCVRCGVVVLPEFICTVATEATFVAIPGLPVTPDTVANDTFCPLDGCNWMVCPTFAPVATIPPWIIAPDWLTTLTWPPTVCKTVLPWAVLSTLNCCRDGFWRTIWNWVGCVIGLPVAVIAPIIGIPPFVTTPDTCWFGPIDRRNWFAWICVVVTFWAVKPLTDTTADVCEPDRGLNWISCIPGAVTMRWARNEDVVAFEGRPDVVNTVPTPVNWDTDTTCDTWDVATWAGRVCTIWPELCVGVTFCWFFVGFLGRKMDY